MPEIGRWNNLEFEVSPSVIRSFNDLKIKVASDTDTVSKKGQQYTKRKNWKPMEISFTVNLHAGLGYDVQSEANAFIQAALTGGVTDYFYVGSRKLVACRLMLTEATVSRVEISAGGSWIHADVALTLEQASLLDGTKTASRKKGSGSKKLAVTAAMTELQAIILSAKRDSANKAGEIEIITFSSDGK